MAHRALREYSPSDLGSSASAASEGVMRCVSCQEEYEERDAGTCRECYEEAKETEDELKRQIEDLRSKLLFLRSAAATATFSDVVLLAEDDPASSQLPIPAHRAILASRSEVFRAMLDSNMSESKSGTIRIRAVSYEALHAFVNFLYRAEASLDDRLACDLLALADMYQVSHLKTYCESYLARYLTWETSVATYAYAQHHNAHFLRDAALSLIIDNMERLTNREAYLDLKARDPRLIVNIYEAYLAKQVNTAARRGGSPRN